ncbi:MAG: DUF1634 domain-containing protein [Gemmatimonadaceae bacterium]
MNATPDPRVPPAASATREPDAEWRMEQIVGRVLQVGVLVAAALVLAGGLVLLFQHGGARADFHEFVGVPEQYRTVLGSLRAALALDGRGLVQLGIIVLIATPVTRVALTLVAFLLQRDRTYVALTAVVLGVLLYGLIWSPV